MSRLARRVPAAVGGLAVVAAMIVGCSETVTGTPQADPAQTGVPLSPDTTTSRPSRTSGPSPSTTAPTVPTRTTSPGGAVPDVNTTCADYDGMDDTARRALMVELGKKSVLIADDPDAWAKIADMLCAIAKPTSLVSDVVMGKI
jgi:hypothetical protein